MGDYWQNFELGWYHPAPPVYDTKNTINGYSRIIENTIPKITKEDLRFLRNQHGSAKDAESKGFPYAKWLLRAMDEDMKAILVEGRPESHLLSYGEIDGKIIIYPKIQQIGNELRNMDGVPFAKDAAMRRAYESGNYLVVPDSNSAERIINTYKQYAKGYRQFDVVPNQSDSFAIQNTKNKQRIGKQYLNGKNVSFNGVNYQLKPHHVAAILGNYLVESGLDETKKETGGRGYGLAQWTDPNRRAGLDTHTPKVESEFERQLDYTLKELGDPYRWYDKNLADDFFNAETIEDAAKYFMSGFEAPKSDSSHIDRRIDASKYLYNN